MRSPEVYQDTPELVLAQQARPQAQSIACIASQPAHQDDTVGLHVTAPQLPRHGPGGFGWHGVTVLP